MRTHGCDILKVFFSVAGEVTICMHLYFIISQPQRPQSHKMSDLIVAAVHFHGKQFSESRYQRKGKRRLSSPCPSSLIFLSASHLKPAWHQKLTRQAYEWEQLSLEQTACQYNKRPGLGEGGLPVFKYMLKQNVCVCRVNQLVKMVLNYLPIPSQKF